MNLEDMTIKLLTETNKLKKEHKSGLPTMITHTCPMCNDDYYMEVDSGEYTDYMNRHMKIQDAFPELNPMEREFIKSGYCPKCQKQLFGSNYKSRKIKKDYDY